MDPSAAPVPIETLLAHRQWVRGLARSLVRDDSAADDVAQDAWVAALAHPPRDEATSRGWFAVVARNVARARGRSDARRAGREEAVARPEAQPAADEVVAQAEIHRRVVEETMALAEPYRTTVLLRYFEGLPLAEIATRMGAPLETVRTRLRRAHEQLRERLGSVHDGDARAALLVLAASGGTAENAGAARGRVARRGNVVRWVGAGALLVAAALTAVVVFDPFGHGAARSGGGPGLAAAPPPAVPADPDGAPAPAAPPAGDDPSGGAPVAIEDDKPAPAAPAAQPAADPAGTLRLRIAISPEVPRAGDSFELRATFENGGEGRLKFFVPQHAGADAFPAWRLVAEDGTVFVPASWIGQSMWTRALQGTLVDLGPGETWSCRNNVSEFSPIDTATGQADDWHVRGALRAGRYVVSASYEKADRDVPWSDEAFKVVKRTIDGLWTGTVRASDVAVRVDGPSRAMLTIDSPHEVVPGSAYVVEAVIENPGPTEHVFAGSLVCRAYTKGEGALATFRPEPQEILGGADAVTAAGVRVGAESSVRLTFDMSRCAEFTSRWTSYVFLVATIEKDEKTPILESNALIRTVKPPPDASATGLRLAASARRGANGEPLLEVTLRNAGQSALRVPRDLAAPASLSFRVRRRDVAPGESAMITVAEDRGTLTTETVEWTVRVPLHDGPATADDFTELIPGATQTRSFDLSAAQHPQLPPGAYTITATWWNVDRGARSGLADGAVVVGCVTSEAVPLDR
jgi:RNA polymerase sigma-70 factor (ECF subfamily)